MLADSYFPIYLVFGPIAAILSLVAAIIIEIPVLKVLWKKPFWSVTRWVFFANLLSALFGVWPITCSRAMAQIGPLSDPLAVYQSYWRNQVLLAGLLFGTTLIIEFTTCFLLNWRRAGLSVRKLAAGILIANLASYAALVTYAFTHFRPTGTSDFVFEPDAKWVRADNTRVWFVDPRARLCSVRLDGSDLRVEVNEILAHEEIVWSKSSFYAVLPQEDAILYADGSRTWHLHQRGEDTSLSPKLPEDWQYSFDRSQFWPAMESVLQETCRVRHDSTCPPCPVFFFMHEWHNWFAELNSREYVIRTEATPDGAGGRIRLQPKDGGKELEFSVSNGLLNLGCLAPAVLEDKGLIVFRCGGWLMIMDPKARRVGRLVEGDSLLLQTPAFGPPPQPTTKAGEQAIRSR
jgi:hypothetical protein